MDVQQLPPAPVSYPAGPLGRADDVGEQDGGQHPVRRGGPTDPSQKLLDVVESEFGRLPVERHVGPWKLDQLRAGDVLGQVASMLDGDELNVPAVEDERWRLDQRQDGACVDLEQGAQKAWTARGLAAVRWNFAYQRRNRSSPARLGT